MKSTNKDLFIKFLKENLIYQRFIVCYEDCKSSNHEESFISFLKKSTPALYLVNGFRWKDTNEGYDYWHEISNKWIHCLNNLKGWKVKT